jgi:thiamine pyridinylase
MTTRLFGRTIVGLAIGLLASTAASADSAKVTLRAALFPYLPDANGDSFRALLARIEKEFEAQHPEVDLVLRPLDPVNDDFYDACGVSKWLRTKDRTSGWDVVEIDSVILNDVLGLAELQDWGAPDARDWHPAARSAVSLDGKTYGIPHWLCGHFIFSRADAVIRARTGAELVSALRRLGSPSPDLVGSLEGSWNLPSLYLDAWADTNGPRRIQQAVTPSLDRRVRDTLKAVAHECDTAQGNPCVDGRFSDNDDAAKQFGRCEADALLGYSERLHPILKEATAHPCPGQVRLASAPLGNGNHPLLFVDSFVLSTHCSEGCRRAAEAFAGYMNSAATARWILLSQDEKQGLVPRYLLPATLSALEEAEVKRDPYYRELRMLIKDGAPFPNAGLLLTRRRMNSALMDALQSPTAVPSPHP